MFRNYDPFDLRNKNSRMQDPGGKESTFVDHNGKRKYNHHPSSLASKRNRPLQANPRGRNNGITDSIFPQASVVIQADYSCAKPIEIPGMNDITVVRAPYGSDPLNWMNMENEIAAQWSDDTDEQPITTNLALSTVRLSTSCNGRKQTSDCKVVGLVTNAAQSGHGDQYGGALTAGTGTTFHTGRRKCDRFKNLLAIPWPNMMLTSNQQLVSGVKINGIPDTKHLLHTMTFDDTDVYALQQDLKIGLEREFKKHLNHASFLSNLENYLRHTMQYHDNYPLNNYGRCYAHILCLQDLVDPKNKATISPAIVESVFSKANDMIMEQFKENTRLVVKFLRGLQQEDYIDEMHPSMQHTLIFDYINNPIGFADSLLKLNQWLNDYLIIIYSATLAFFQAYHLGVTLNEVPQDGSVAIDVLVGYKA